MMRNQSIINKKEKEKVKRQLKKLNKKVKKTRKLEVMRRYREILMRRIWKTRLNRKMRNLMRRIFCREDHGMIKVNKK